VRYEDLSNSEVYNVQGGWVRLKEKKIVILDSKGSVAEQIRILTKALGAIDLNEIYLKPSLRDLFEKQ
jgi:hypothetical protein